MTDDLVLAATQRFMDVVEQRLVKQADENRVLREEVRSLLGELQTRAAAPPTAGPPGPVGKDGEPGKDGKDGARGDKGDGGPAGKDGERGLPGERGADGLQGRDGTDGKDGARGADGIATREEIEAIVEQRHTDVQVRTLADYHQRTFSRGTDYKRGALVAWAGATWLAMVDTAAEPMTSPDWQMIAKAGRDGRDGRK